MNRTVSPLNCGSRSTSIRFRAKMFVFVFVPIICLLLDVPRLVSAQQAGQARRPKIGLALSGGGARGFAHVGVLQWFEEHRIPVDYLAGTSMGGLIGGMYATGMNATQIRDLVRDLDWDVLLRGYPDFRN